MKEAKILFDKLQKEFGYEYMNMITNNWNERLIYDFMKDGTIADYIKSLY